MNGPVPYFEVFRALAPQCLLVIAAFACLTFDLVALRRADSSTRNRTIGIRCDSGSGGGSHLLVLPDSGVIGGWPRGVAGRDAGGGRADGIVQPCARRSDLSHRGHLDGIRSRETRRRVFCHVVVRRDRDDVAGQHRRTHHHFRGARTDQHLPLHPDRVPQGRTPVAGGGGQVFHVRRNFVGVPAVRAQLRLWIDRYDQPARDREGHPDHRRQPADGGRPDVCHRRIRLQGGDCAVPSLGARCVRRRADSGDGVYCHRFEGGQFLRVPEDACCSVSAECRARPFGAGSSRAG